MAEYIEREVIKMQMLKYGFRAPDMTITEFVKDELSGVDVVPIVHGHWFNGQSGNYKICSECSQIADFDFNYCPNCGAKMDGKQCNGLLPSNKQRTNIC